MPNIQNVLLSCFYESNPTIASITYLLCSITLDPVKNISITWTTVGLPNSEQCGDMVAPLRFIHEKSVWKQAQRFSPLLKRHTPHFPAAIRVAVGRLVADAVVWRPTHTGAKMKCLAPASRAPRIQIRRLSQQQRRPRPVRAQRAWKNIPFLRLCLCSASDRSLSDHLTFQIWGHPRFLHFFSDEKYWRLFVSTVVILRK